MCGCYDHSHGADPAHCACCQFRVKCEGCSSLLKRVAELEALNDRLAVALRGEVSRPSNTDMILGAALSGGDVVKLAETLSRKG